MATTQPDIRTMGGSGEFTTASISVSRTYLTFPDWHGSRHKAVGFPEADSRKKAGVDSSKREVKNGNHS